MYLNLKLCGNPKRYERDYECKATCVVLNPPPKGIKNISSFELKSDVNVSISDKTTRGIVWRDLLMKNCTKSFTWRIENPATDIYNIFLKLWRRKKILNASDMLLLEKENSFNAWLIPVRVVQSAILIICYV
eukprot:UN26455